MSISRFGWLCCKQAAAQSGRSSPPEPEPGGHRLELAEGEQRRLHEDVKALSRSGRAVIRATGGGVANVYAHELVRFLLLAKRAAVDDEDAT